MSSHFKGPSIWFRIFLAAACLILLLFGKCAESKHQKCRSPIVLSISLITHPFCFLSLLVRKRYTEVLEENPPLLFSQPPTSAKYERIDWFLFFHLSIGLLWLCAASLQIYKHKVGGWSFEREEHWKTHRMFGKVSILIALLHTLMMTYITFENPVKQAPIIRWGYLGMVFQSAKFLYYGTKYARLTARSTGDEKKKSKKLHEMNMFLLYVKTIRGSGTIRISAWLFWLVGQFLS